MISQILQKADDPNCERVISNQCEEISDMRGIALEGKTWRESRLVGLAH